MKPILKRCRKVGSWNRGLGRGCCCGRFAAKSGFELRGKQARPSHSSLLPPLESLKVYINAAYDVLARAPSSQNLDAMIHRVAHDHAALFVHHHPPERVLEMAVAAAFLADDAHV